MMKHAFYFILKALFDLKIFKCLSGRLDPEGKRMDKKAKADFNIYIAINWETNYNILHNISRSKNNQTMKFRLLKRNTHFFIIR